MGEEKGHPGTYIFCIASGEVVPLKVFSMSHVWPWDWLRKFSPKAELLIPKLPRHTYHLMTGLWSYAPRGPHRCTIICLTILYTSIRDVDPTIMIDSPTRTLLQPVVSPSKPLSSASPVRALVLPVQLVVTDLEPRWSERLKTAHQRFLCPIDHILE